MLFFVTASFALTAQPVERPNELYCPKTGRAEECGPEVFNDAKLRTHTPMTLPKYFCLLDH